MEKVQNLIEFIHQSPTPYHATEAIANRLEKEGFTKLAENKPWDLKSGGSYYVVRDQSSVICFKTGLKSDFRGYRIVASHSDTPGFKLKPNGIAENANYRKLNTEVYGGPIFSTWTDRPLGLAGRVFRKTKEGLISEFVNIPDVCLIPNLPIHFNREVNKGIELNAQVDMQAVLGVKNGSEKITLNELLKKDDLVSHDLFLYNGEKGKVLASEDIFVSPRIDNLECAFATLEGFLQAKNDTDILVYACFNNEEIGSATKQGAGSTFLKDVLERIGFAFGKSWEAQKIALANSVIVSADNAHAIHPNRPEKFDFLNYAKLNEGIVIKHSARQSYTSDAFSVALFQAACDKARVPYQAFANRSDERGGGTLGAISSSQVSITSVDIGLAQLAMHSALESAGTQDVIYMIEAIRSFMEMDYSLDQPNLLIE